MNDTDFGRQAQQLHRKHNAPVRSTRDVYEKKGSGYKGDLTHEEKMKSDPEYAKRQEEKKKLKEENKDATPAKIEKESKTEGVDKGDWESKTGPVFTPEAAREFSKRVGKLSEKEQKEREKKESKDVNPETLGTELKEFFNEEAGEPEHAKDGGELIPIDDAAIKA